MRQCSIDWWSDTPDNRQGVFAAGEIEVVESGRTLNRFDYCGTSWGSGLSVVWRSLRAWPCAIRFLIIATTDGAFSKARSCALFEIARLKLPTRRQGDRMRRQCRLLAQSIGPGPSAFHPLMGG